ncbi:histidine-containing phosphotransfer protein 1-like isoform X2 [Abrus precatorius]|uniref:Histidine-containing phosphotransfer protein n=1 Tax=Abrus precatorius TaxID=3816 RepID=A0A8B8KGT3_ABRPR|nr:histidine-containing phosphotransfer protein 1-like isoform X2 [Abrus precatorius]
MGVVNDKFNETLSLKRTGEPDCVVQLIETYFEDVETMLSEIYRHIDNSKADFRKLASLAREIEDRSTSIGAEHMRLACPDLIKACDEKHKNNFQVALPWLRNEFDHTRNKLGSFVQMERRIIRLESAQSSNQSSHATSLNCPSAGSD